MNAVWLLLSNIFPGDGVDERDQHILTSVNSFSTENGMKLSVMCIAIDSERCKDCDGRSYCTAGLCKSNQSECNKKRDAASGISITGTFNGIAER